MTNQRTPNKGEPILKKYFILMSAAWLPLMSGCATASQSTWLGIGAGAALGAASGAALDREDSGRGAMYGALAMAAIGGVVGYFTQDALNDRDAKVRQDTLFNLERFGVTGAAGAQTPAPDAASNQKVLILTDPEWSHAIHKKENGN